MKITMRKGGMELITRNQLALEVNSTAGGLKISVVVVHRSLGWTPVEDGELLFFLRVVVGSAGNILILEDFNASEIN